MSLMIVAPWPTAEEAESGQFFSSVEGKFLRKQLAKVGLSMSEAYLTYAIKKPVRDIMTLLGSKSEGVGGLPAIKQSKYLRSEYATEITRLFLEVEHAKPNCILALGNLANTFLLKSKSIKGIRGTPNDFAFNGTRYKVIPTYEVSSVFREWSLLPIFLSDLHKVRDNVDFPEVRRPSRQIWIEPNLDDLYRFEREHILPSASLSIDIETNGTQITCIGFAPTPQVGIVVPFTSANTGVMKSYWATHTEEVMALKWCKRMCELPKAICGQNIMYDMQHLWRNYGITIPHMTNDSMLLHHALQPEMEKGLAFLGSIYTDEQAWKFMRHVETVKRED